MHNIYAIAGQTTEPNWLKFLQEIHGYPKVFLKMPRASQCTSTIFLIYIFKESLVNSVLIKLVVSKICDN